MSVIDFDTLGAYVDLPAHARRLLERSEKEIQCSLSLRIDADRLIEATCYVVYHNSARGPAKGGIRMMPTVTLDSTRDLAERMTYKASLAGIPFGGGKSGIRIDGGSLNRFEKTALLREFCHMLSLELNHGMYIPAPDMGTDASDMAVIYGRFERPEVVTGKPPRVGGLPGRNEATGKGVASVCDWASLRYLGSTLKGHSVAVQGFGNVGWWTAAFLAGQGAKIVAVSDVTGGLYDPAGLAWDELGRLCPGEGGLASVAGARAISNTDLLLLDVDILVPAAAGNQIDETVAEALRARLVVEGANGPVTPEGDRMLEARGIPVIPDVLANAGGVIASYVEWRNGKSGSITDKEDTYQVIERTLKKSWGRVMEMVKRHGLAPRMAAHAVSLREVVEAMKDRGWI